MATWVGFSLGWPRAEATVQQGMYYRVLGICLVLRLDVADYLIHIVTSCR